MAGLFEVANKLVVLAAGRSLEWTNRTAIAVQDADPAAVNDGVALLTSPTVLFRVQPSSGATASVRVWAYSEAAGGWSVVNGGAFDTVADVGLYERINVGGLDRLFIQVTAITGGTVDISIGKAIVE